MTENDLERRLRGALAARAATVTRRDLRHEPAPSHGARRNTPLRWWLPMAAGLAAAAVSITVFVLLRPTDPAPAPPASPASPVQPASPDRSIAPTPAASPTASALDTTPTSVPSASPPTASRPAPKAEPTLTASRPSPTLAPTSP
jgi:hypothetical protein